MTKLRLCMIADSPGWCFDRTGQALGKYHGTEHEWVTVYGGQPGALPEADVYRYGGVHIWAQLNHERRFPTQPGAAVFLGFSSFKDISPTWLRAVHAQASGITGFIVNDLRMLPVVARLGKPVIYSPDRADHEVFLPMTQLRPSEGPLRVGWAGSQRAWGNAKHVPEIEEACRVIGPIISFVCQDRETCGCLDQHGMARWLNSLDLYISANDSCTCTPVPILEAIACGIPVVTTRCGELWPVLRHLWPGAIIESPTPPAIGRELRGCLSLGRVALAKRGQMLRSLLGDYFINWRCGEARRVTEAMVRIVRGEQ